MVSGISARQSVTGRDSWDGLMSTSKMFLSAFYSFSSKEKIVAWQIFYKKTVSATLVHSPNLTPYPRILVIHVKNHFVSENTSKSKHSTRII